MLTPVSATNGGVGRARHGTTEGVRRHLTMPTSQKPSTPLHDVVNALSNLSEVPM